jgi:serine/threonine protein kinase
MVEAPHCLECGVGLPAGSGIRLCARCQGGGDLSETVPLKPGERSAIRTSPTSMAAVGLADFRRAILELELLDAERLDRSALEATGDVSLLAATLVRANCLTEYQAAALVQGKARGLVIGPYLVLSRCGQGGMGVVFKARHRPTGQVVALKILPPSFARDATLVHRFRREVAAAARLDHPNIVKILDASQDRGVHFLVMEHIEGRDLKGIVASNGPLSIDQAIACMIQAARGLGSAHEKGIVHRDIKPANLMLDTSGVVRVLDLGLARLVEASGIFGGNTADSLTQSGSYMGTVDYSAPEQADDAKTVDHRADIYSLGCTLYFLVAGRPPFEGDSLIKKLMAHQNRPAPSLQSARSEVPASLEAAYLAMMAKNPAERPQSMAAVIWLLEDGRESAALKPKSKKGLITFVDGRPMIPDSRERGRGVDAKRPAGLRPGDGRPFDPDPGVYDLEFEDPATATPADESLAEVVFPDWTILPSGPERSPVSPRFQGLGAAVVLVIVGSILAWAIRFHRAPRNPSTAIGTTSPRLVLEPKSGAVPAKPTTKPDRSPRPPEPPPTKRTPAGPKTSAKSAEPAGFTPIFNGKDLAGWDGMIEDYEVGDGVIRSRSTRRTIIFFPMSFTDFTARVEFRLPPGGDGGLAIRYPGEGDPAYSSMCEIQLLDDTAPRFADLDPRQFCGSAFGMVAARRGHLRPAGEWNSAEVTARGSTIRVELNGAVILDADLRPVHEFLDDRPHPGKDRRSGFFGLTAEGSPVEYRNVRIRELKP